MFTGEVIENGSINGYCHLPHSTLTHSARIYKLRWEDGTVLLSFDKTIFPSEPKLRATCINQIIDAIDLPEWKPRLSDLATPVWIGKNALSTGLGKNIRYALTHNSGAFFDEQEAKEDLEGQLSKVSSGDEVVLFYHGYWQNGRAAQQFVEDAERRGLVAITPSYDYHLDPGEHFAEMTSQHYRAILDKGANVIGCVGHSNGGDGLRYAILQDPKLAELMAETESSIVFSGTITAGMRNLSLRQKIIFRLLGKLADRDKFETETGKQHFTFCNQPLPEGVAAYNFIQQGDLLALPRFSLATNTGDVNIIVPGGGHFAGSGVSSQVNHQYLHLLQHGISSE